MGSLCARCTPCSLIAQPWVERRSTHSGVAVVYGWTEAGRLIYALPDHTVRPHQAHHHLHLKHGRWHQAQVVKAG